MHPQQICDNIKLSGPVDTPEEWDASQRHLGKFEKWVHRNILRFNKTKCKVLHSGRSRPWYQHRLGDKQTKSSPAEKDLGMRH